MPDCEWQPIDEHTPVQTLILLWFIGNNAPFQAQGVIVGEISIFNTGNVWDGYSYRPLIWFSHWMPLPEPPKERNDG